MASLTKSIANWVRGKRDDAAASMKDDVRDGKFSIEDSEKQITQYRAALAKYMQQNILSEGQAKSAKAESDKYQRLAKQAAEAGNEEDARSALTTKVQADARYKALMTQIKANKDIIANQRKTIANGEAKIAQAKSNHAMLSARKEGAKARKALAAAQTPFDSDNNPLAALDDLQKSVDADEAEAQAMEELAGVGELSLEEKYGTAGDTSVDAELEKLMGKK
tara:strand:- start:786 stop:1451 length:666 start_codon:yes stop_codon:yes gene_type:complete